jgi:hypothetical protein
MRLTETPLGPTQRSPLVRPSLHLSAMLEVWEHALQAAEKLPEIASCGRGSESAMCASACLRLPARLL